VCQCAREDKAQEESDRHCAERRHEQSQIRAVEVLLLSSVKRRRRAGGQDCPNHLIANLDRLALRQLSRWNVIAQAIGRDRVKLAVWAVSVTLCGAAAGVAARSLVVPD
jgi:hypothetical protein